MALMQPNVCVTCKHARSQLGWFGGIWTKVASSIHMLNGIPYACSALLGLINTLKQHVTYDSSVYLNHNYWHARGSALSML